MPTPPRQRRIHSKVAAGSSAGAAGLVLVWALQQLGVEMTAEVAGAIVLLASQVAAYAKTVR